MSNNSSLLLKNEQQTSQPETLVVVNCILSGPLMLISVTGNMLVLVAILRTHLLHFPSNVFLCCLAVSDLLVGLVVQPVYIAYNLQLSNLLRRAYNMLALSLCGASLAMMTVISVDRLLALHYHLRYPNLMTEKRAIYISVIVFFSSLTLSCIIFWSRNVFFLSIAVGIALCLLISSSSYIRIYFIVRRHQIQIETQQRALQSLNAQQNPNIILQSKKSAINTFIYYICMILCYCPVGISMLLASDSFGTGQSAQWSFADTVAFMNSSINPFLYCWRARELRTALVNTLRSIFPPGAAVN